MPEIDDLTKGYLAEFEFIREGMRQDQRERQGFLGFSLAASGLILGLLMRSSPPRSATEACFLVGLAAGVTLVAERLTIRASHGVASGGAYMRLYIEPHVEGLGFQERNRRYMKQIRGSNSVSRGLGYAYVALTAAFVLAWLAAPLTSGRAWWQTLIVSVLAVASLLQAGKLLISSIRGWPVVNNAWDKVFEEEFELRREAASSGRPDNSVTDQRDTLNPRREVNRDL